MKRFLLFFCLTLTYLWGGVISAYADDVYFEPESGGSYLIFSKGDHRYAMWNESSTLADNSSVNVLTAVAEISESSYFTIEKTTVDNKRYYYIRSKKDASQYVYAINTNDANSNVGVKSTTEPDASCLWDIVYNKTSRGFNIKPKDGSNGWNCRSSNPNYQQVGQWSANNNNNNTWFFISEPCTLNGYYTLKNGASDSRPTNYYNDFVANSNNVSRASNNLPENVTNNYIWHVTSSNNVITVTNGQGTTLKSSDSYGALPQLDVIEYTTNKGFVFGPVLNAGTNGQLTTWESAWDTNTSKGDNCWKFTSVSTEGKTLYTVSIDHADGYVTYTSTSESAQNGGFIFLSATPSAGDFSAGNVDGYASSISIEGTVINVHYARTAESVKSYAAEIKTIVESCGILDKEGVGYPLASAKEAYRTALQNAENAVTGKTEEEYNALVETFQNAYNSLLTSAQMPEDGKAYKIVYQYINGKNQQLYWNGTRTATKEEENITDSYSAIFVCHKTEDGKYLFATNQGTYLSWYDSGNTSSSNSTSGVTDSYSACNLWTVEIADNNANGGSIAASISRVDLLGCFQMKAPSKDDNNNLHYLQTRYEGENADGAFISRWANNKYYDENDGKPRSHAFKFVEVEYPNTVNFNSTNGAVSGVSYIATFSAPFATVIPDGVTAYYVVKNESKAELKEITSEAIPANTGVLLGSESANNKVCMIPATSEEASVDASNALGNTAGQSKILTKGECYILGAKNGKVAFYPTAAGTLPMNKAYLKKDASDNTTSSFQMVFNGETTGIEDILTDEDANAPVYDLTGRRVLKAVKGGVYIKNGMKFIVK